MTRSIYNVASGYAALAYKLFPFSQTRCHWRASLVVYASHFALAESQGLEAKPRIARQDGNKHKLQLPEPSL